MKFRHIWSIFLGSKSIKGFYDLLCELMPAICACAVVTDQTDTLAPFVLRTLRCLSFGQDLGPS